VIWYGLVLAAMFFVAATSAVVQIYGVCVQQRYCVVFHNREVGGRDFPATHGRGIVYS
jgi:hypothetical protein